MDLTNKSPRQVTAIARKAYALPMLKREKFVNGLSIKDREQLCAQAYSDAQAAAWTIGYLEDRGCAGCGDNGHGHATKAAEKLRKKVRRAVGYSYP